MTSGRILRNPRHEVGLRIQNHRLGIVAGFQLFIGDLTEAFRSR